MYVRLIQLIDEDYGEIYVFPFYGLLDKHIKDNEIKKLKNLVLRYPDQHTKLKDMLERDTYAYVVPNRFDLTKNWEFNC